MAHSLMSMACAYMQVHKTGVRKDTYTIFIYLFIYLFIYFKRVTHLAKIAILLYGPLLT